VSHMLSGALAEEDYWAAQDETPAEKENQENE
jgi:hypothetical protein